MSRLLFAALNLKIKMLLHAVLGHKMKGKAELKASNDFYENRLKVFFGSSRKSHGRIDQFVIE